jgi:hypothetical protein
MCDKPLVQPDICATRYHVRHFSHFGFRIQQLGSTTFKGCHFGAKISQTTCYGSTPFFLDPVSPIRIDHHFVLFILVFCVNKVTQKLDFSVSTSLSSYRVPFVSRIPKLGTPFCCSKLDHVLNETRAMLSLLKQAAS